ncbi:MAG: hypothetical protein ACPHOK_06190, partial [Akkermansiaceae bacterium]
MPFDQHCLSPRRALCLFISFATTLTAVPVANDDTFAVDEDRTLTILKGGTILSATFEAGRSVLSPTWEYLDRIENENGFNQTYPQDANGLIWNTPQFATAT